MHDVEPAFVVWMWANINVMNRRRLTRRTFLRAAGLGGAATLLSSLASRGAGARKPNIILIYADDLDFDRIGIYDHRKYPTVTGARELGFTNARHDWERRRNARQLTPHIDSLARDGAMFSRFYVTTAICTPSRYSILTGRYASRSPRFQKAYPTTGQANIQWNTQLAPMETNIARALAAAGYATGIVGKWHLGAPVGRVKGVGRDAEPTDPHVVKALKEAHRGLTMYLRERIGFDYADRMYMQNKEWMGLPKPLQVHNLEWITEGALNFIDRNRNRPFFLYMPLTTPHGAYTASFLKSNPLFTPAGVLDRLPKGQTSRGSIPGRIKAAGIPARNAMGTWIDDSVGAILNRLDRLELAEDTVVIFASDHQGRGKYTCYEGCRVPFVIRWPGHIRAGTPIDAICANIDLPATFMDIAGARPPKDMVRDGVSMLPVLEGRTDGWRNSLLLECSNIRAVVTKDYKYIANRPPDEDRRRMEEDARMAAKKGIKRTVGWDGNKNPHKWENGIRFAADHFFPHYFDYDQLYDLNNDPFEQNNLAADLGHAKIFMEMQELLKKKLQDLPHPFPI